MIRNGARRGTRSGAPHRVPPRPGPRPRAGRTPPASGARRGCLRARAPAECCWSRSRRERPSRAPRQVGRMQRSIDRDRASVATRVSRRCGAVAARQGRAHQQRTEREASREADRTPRIGSTRLHLRRGTGRGEVVTKRAGSHAREYVTPNCDRGVANATYVNPRQAPPSRRRSLRHSEPSDRTRPRAIHRAGASRPDTHPPTHHRSCRAQRARVIVAHRDAHRVGQPVDLGAGRVPKRRHRPIA